MSLLWLCLASALTIETIAQPEELSDSLINEIEHALERAPKSAPFAEFDFGGNTATERALKVVSAQGADGHWRVKANNVRWQQNTKDVSFAAVGELRRLKGEAVAGLTPVFEDTWHGYRRVRYGFGHREAVVVFPKVEPAAGKPWTWTIQWWDAFVERTGVLELLAKGYHHVWLDAFADRGNQRAIDDFAAFQAALVKGLGLAPKTKLVGMSWGGFFSTRYAAAHPENVDCIYLDAPLLNLSALQGVTGTKADRSIGPWAAESPASGNWLDDKRMPVNLAEKLAAAKIPLLLLYGGKDTVVDPTKSCLPFVKRFCAAGGSVKVVPRPNYGHHPHGVDKTELGVIVEFLSR